MYDDAPRGAYVFVTRLKLKNWFNFRQADVRLHPRTFVLGANASGKSNFLEVFRFLRDVSKPQGGGLQEAIRVRGGISKLRCLHARQDTEVRIEVELAENPEDEVAQWRYVLGFKAEGKGLQRVLVTVEEVTKVTDRLLSRPVAEDSDVLQRTETYLEQTRANEKFRELASFFSATTYLHLLPQLLKHPESIRVRLLEDDPFGQSFLERVAKTSARTRDARLRRIEQALVAAVPQFRNLRYVRDPINGLPHLEALYSHHRPNAGWQREDQFSDGTLRLLGLLWALLDGDSLLLIEEPELSLNDAIVRQIPLMLQRIQKASKRRRQIILSTHSEALLSAPGIDGRGVLLIEPGAEGSRVRQVDPVEAEALKSGFTVAEVVLPKTRPEGVGQLAFWE